MTEKTFTLTESQLRFITAKITEQRFTDSGIAEDYAVIMANDVSGQGVTQEEMEMIWNNLPVSRRELELELAHIN